MLCVTVSSLHEPVLWIDYCAQLSKNRHLGTHFTSHLSHSLEQLLCSSYTFCRIVA